MICFGNCFKTAICKFKCIQHPFIFPQSNKSVEEEEQKQCDKGYAKNTSSDELFSVSDK